MTKIGIAIVEIRGHYLVGLRGAGSLLAGRDEFPGGKQAGSESTQETAVRECHEETGLRVRAIEMVYQTSHEYPHGEVQLDFWLCVPEARELENLPEVIAPWRWVTATELTALNFPPANSEVVALLRQQRQILRSEY